MVYLRLLVIGVLVGWSTVEALAQQPRRDLWSSLAGKWVPSADLCTDDGPHRVYVFGAMTIDGYEQECRVVSRSRAGNGVAVRAVCRQEGDLVDARFVIEPLPTGRIMVTETVDRRTVRSNLTRCGPAERATTVEPGPLKSDIESNIVQQLTCQQRPHGLAAIVYLSRNSLINVNRREGIDNASCFHLKREFQVGGLPVAAICVSETDHLTIALWPNVYFTSRGFVPPPMLSIITRATDAEVRRWAAMHLPADRPRHEIRGATLVPNATEISCTRGIE